MDQSLKRNKVFKEGQHPSSARMFLNLLRKKNASYKTLKLQAMEATQTWILDSLAKQCTGLQKPLSSTDCSKVGNLPAHLDQRFDKHV